MDTIKKLLGHQKEIIEGVFISVITSWALMSILSGAAVQIGNKEFTLGANFVLKCALMLVIAAVIGFGYYKNASIVRIGMFIVVYGFLLLTSISGYNQVWSTQNKNPIGNVCLQTLLGIIAVLAFLYVKEDVFKLFRKISISKKASIIIFAVVGVLLFTFVAITTVYRYYTYSNSTYDFGIFAQMYEYMKQTGAINTTVERNTLLSHFGVHFSPIFYIGLPIYFIFPSPITVQMIQALMIALPVIPIVLLCRHYKMSNWMAVAMIILYALYPATASGAFYDIHENCFLTFFILFAIYALEKKKDLWAILCVLLVFFTKEDAAIYILVLGAFLILSRKDKKRGIILMIVSAAYFVIAVSIVKSYGLGVLDDRFSNLYADANGGFLEIIKTVLLNPSYALSQMVTNFGDNQMDKIGYIMLMLVPIAAALFTTGKKYSRYILLSPFILINVMTTYLYLHDISFQYNFGIIALFMYVMIMNLQDMKVEKAKTIVGVCVICASLMFVGTVYPKMTYYLEKYDTDKATYTKLDNAMDTYVPQNASVCASGFFTPHLSKHLEMYDQNHLTEDKYTDYLVVDERNQNEAAKFTNIVNSGKYELVYREDNLISIYHLKDNK